MEATVRKQTTHRPRETRTVRSPRIGLSPYLIDEIAMTRTEILGARGMGPAGTDA